MNLGAVLEFIKEEQNKAPPKKQRAGKQRSRYKPNGRRNDGWNSLADRKRIADRKTSQPGLRYLRSPPRQAFLPSALKRDTLTLQTEGHFHLVATQC